MDSNTTPDATPAARIKTVFEDVLASDFAINGWLGTAILILVLLSARFFLVRLIRGKVEILGKQQRRWINRVNNTTTALMVIGLVFIWAPELRAFALSLTAVALAVVILTKEILSCLSGSFLRATVNPFEVGDWITVEGLMGEVLQISALSTELQEIDGRTKSYQFTGRTFFIPNSKFLTANVENANFTRNFLFHDFSITVPSAGLNTREAIEKLREITEARFDPVRKEAHAFLRRVEQKSKIDFAEPEPRYSLRTTDLGHLVFTVILFVKTEEALAVSTAITSEFLEWAAGQSGENAGEQERTGAG